MLIFNAESVTWILKTFLSFALSRWLSSQFGRRRSRTSTTWLTSAERLRSCRPSATLTSSVYTKVKVCSIDANIHRRGRALRACSICRHRNANVQNSPQPELARHSWPGSKIVMLWHVDVIIGAGLQLWDVIHLLSSVWLPESVKVWMALTMHIWICVCVCMCWRFVCKAGRAGGGGGILRDCLSTS